MTGYTVKIIDRKDSCTIYEFTKVEKVNKGKKFAIVVSENGLEELLSPLELAISCGKMHESLMNILLLKKSNRFN